MRQTMILISKEMAEIISSIENMGIGQKNRIRQK